MINILKDAITEVQLRESGWKLVRIVSKKLVIDKYIKIILEVVTYPHLSVHHK